MKTVVTVTGIRPDFIRMSEVFRRLDESEHIKHILVNTGQHYDRLLSTIFFEQLNIRKPDYNLRCGGGDHVEQNSKRDSELYNLIKELDLPKDTIFLFLGDSNSVMSSVFLKKEGYRVGHIEAGQRSHDMRMKEEVNRIICDSVSDYAYCYHSDFVRNLKRESFRGESLNVGNTIVEVVKKHADLDYVGTKEHILLDIHRPENFLYPERLIRIILFSQEISKIHKKPVKMLAFGRTFDRIRELQMGLGSIAPVPLMGYLDFLKFQQDSHFIISDSGTAQEEPALLGIPVIVPREFTERPQSVSNGCSIHISLDNFTEDCFNCTDFVDSKFKNHSVEWLGNGETSKLIVEHLEQV